MLDVTSRTGAREEIRPTPTKEPRTSQAEPSPPLPPEMFVRVPDIGKQPLGFPEPVVTKNGLKADEGANNKGSGSRQSWALTGELPHTSYAVSPSLYHGNFLNCSFLAAFFDIPC